MKLYIVGTPIGNLGDMSPRAVKTLQEVDFIAAEDTRVTLKLLNHFEIKKPMVSYYEHNIRSRGQMIVDRILAGESCAIVTDAGMPCISDPGEDLVRLCAENNIPTEVVPGPSAVISALACSGLITSRFAFEGFLSTNKKNRFEHLESIKNDTRTLIFYEAPHKLMNTLNDMLKVFGGDRRISLAKELTKLHEQIIRTTLSGAVEYFTNTPPKGEFVLVIDGAPPAAKEEMTFEEALQLVEQLREEKGLPLSAACKEAAKISGIKKGELYAACAE